ncbi:hypothetical protein E3U55_11160 [Filobacillus milosensis]|uniref:Uncharacterized protein n=1 Tax=Filobacillus milosensis TaxID=94137 RepID=A0A4Y8IFK7_9BACI|nr:hypothetical protein [Filobacillus milosensis]TFB19263.1 hypothetical protein E3U55_11160 [Filobacillus milosensis]
MDLKSIGAFILIGAIVVTMFFINQNEDDQSNHYYVFLMDGETEHWELDQYKVELVPTNQVAGNGILNYVGEENIKVEDFNFRTFALVDGLDIALQGVSRSWNKPVELGNSPTGTVDSSLFKPNGDPVLFKDIEKIYAVIQWTEAGGETVKEEMTLYERRSR